MSDGMIRIPQLAQASAALDMPAVALADRNNLFGLVKFYSACERQGVKPLVAAEVLVASESRNEAPTTLVLIAKTDQGYRNLCELTSRSYAQGQAKGVPTLQRQWIEAQAEGLVALSGGREGDVGQALLAGKQELALSRLRQWQAAFPDAFYLELQRTNRAREEDYITLAVNLALEADCPVVATNDVCFLERSSFQTHEAKVCLHEGRTLDDTKREKRHTEEQYLKSGEEMHQLFADLPEALENTVEIARRCNVNLNLDTYYLPDYSVPEGETTESFLEAAAKAGLEEKLAAIFDPEAPDFAELRKPYDERLAFELGVINTMGFPSYFLIVMEFIQWAKDNDIPVGPGRGSGAGSLVAYSLKITNIDPLAYDLLFERFLNPERVSLPDFDIDFCIDGRDRVIQHVSERYGRDAVSQIITFGTMAAKAVVRDVTRVQNKAYGLAERLAKLIPMDPGITLAKALEETPELQAAVDASPEAQEVIAMAFQLEGFTKSIGRHAGGVVIAPTKLTDYVPTWSDEAGGALVTQFDMVDVERAGLVKFDFLGLRTLTVIAKAVKDINRRRQEKGEAPIDIDAIDLEDPAIYQDLTQAKATAIFQLESRGMRDLMKKVRPSRFADIVALIALYRPGPMKLADDFIDRKHGRKQVDYLHPSLEPVLEDTYGIMLYQEQVMQIAQRLANYSLADADLLRRAMGKKKPEEMKLQRASFVEGALSNGIKEARAAHIFDLMESFAGYGFNKPHSVAYAIIAYQTAWLKHYYPADFLASMLSAEMQDTTKIFINIEECQALNLTLHPPDVNRSIFKFAADTENSLDYGLGAIKGLGEGAIECIIESRTAEGPFTDLYDFCERLDLKKVNRRAIEALIGSGALDKLVPEALAETTDHKRALLLANLDEAVRCSEQKSRDRDSGLTDLFGIEGEGAQEGGSRYNHRDKLKPLRLRDRLQWERASLGYFLSGHPIDEYQDDLNHLATTKIAALNLNQDTPTVAGFIVSTRKTRSRRGENIAFITLDDKTSRVEVSVYAELYGQHGDKLQEGNVILVKGAASMDDFSGSIRLRASHISSIEESRAGKLACLKLDFSDKNADAGFVEALAEVLTPHLSKDKASCPVTVSYANAGAKGRVILGEDWRVKPADELIHKLVDQYGPDRVHLQYR